MTFSPLQRRLTTVGLTTVTLSALLLAQHAVAYDPAAPYRNQKGFRCYYENSRGECLDFSVGGSSTGTSNNSYNNSVDDFSVDIGAPNSNNLIRRGSVMEFRILLNNESNRNVTTDVRAFLDSGLTFDSASNSGRRISSSEVEWRNVKISDNDDKELLLRLRVSSSLSVGDEVTLSVETEEGASQEVTLEVTNSSVTSVSCDSTYYYVGGRRVYGRSLRSGRSCTNYNNDSDEGDYRISISDSPDPFEPGELITYDIRIENDDDTSRRIDVRAFLDDNLSYVSSSMTPDTVRNDEVVWEEQLIPRNGEKRFTLSVRTLRSLDDGDLVRLRVEAGDGSEEEDTEALFP